MSIWWKEVFVPVLLQLLGELFRTDGEQKYGLGLKISLLTNIMLLVVIGYLSTAYFELYQTTMDKKVEISTLTHAKTEALKDVTELEGEIKDLKTRLGTCETNAKVPSDSYKHEPVTPPPRHINRRSTSTASDYDDDYVEALLESINSG